MPAGPPGPVTTLSTPSGRPASWESSANLSAVSGVSEAGFRATVLPAASAGASFHDASTNGEFQGTIAPTTPTGRPRVNVKAFSRSWIVSPGILVAQPPD